MPLTKGLAACLVIAFLWTSCASTPKKPDTPPVKPPVVTPEPVKPEPQTPAPLVDADFGPARDAIAQAEKADAARYSPNLLAKAKDEFDQAAGLAKTDPDKARALLKSSETDALAARDEALAAQKTAMLDRLERAKQLLLDIKADEFSPAEYQAADAKRAAAVTTLDTDLVAGQQQSTDALKDMVALYESLSKRLAAVQQLQKSVQAALDEADKAEAYIWVPDLLQEANDSYFQGNSSYKKYQLDAAEEEWTNAEFQAQSATAKAKKEGDRKKTEDLMLETMNKIQKASKATIVDPNDNIIAPKPWDGTDTLKQNDLAAPPAGKPQSMLIPKDGSPAVMGDVGRLTYLDDAKAAWEQGVQAMKTEDYALATQYFQQAQKLVDAYMAMAVDKVYTVRLIPERRDSLWRISEYGNIFGNPFDWPKIWVRNKKLIQNPDLIYPGWQLIIPPQ